MKRYYEYTVRYNLFGQNREFVTVCAESKLDAYMEAYYKAIPANEDGQLPYSAWVDSVRYKNGRRKFFNTFEGKPV